MRVFGALCGRVASRERCGCADFPKREELWLRTVFAFPKASSSGLLARSTASTVAGAERLRPRAAVARAPRGSAPSAA